MKLSLKSVIGGAGVLAVAGGMAFAGAGAASAAAPPTFQPDPNSVGSVSFYDASGNQITSGSVNDSPLAAYYKGSGAGVVPLDNLAYQSFVTPVDGQLPVQWQTQEIWTSTQQFPQPSAPGALGTTTDALVKGAATDGSVADHIANFPLASTLNPGVVEVRVYTNHAGSSGNTDYYSTDIKITGNTWVQVYPAVSSVVPTTTTLTAAPNPSTLGDTVTLTATVSPAAAAGSVQFKDGANNLGAPVAVSAGSATKTTSALTQGSHALSAVFTPTDATAYGSSTGTFTATVNPLAPPTTTTLAVGGNPTTAGQDVTLTATVNPAAAPGTVAFFDNGSATPLPGTVTSPTPGTYLLDLPTGFTAGGHSVVAKFSPTDVTAYRASQSGPQAFLTQATQAGACADPNSVCTDVQNIQATIPVGTLVINTPYTAANPLDLGTLVLSTDATKFSGSATFDNIKVTDTRAGNLSWTVSALASALTDGGVNPGSTINAQNVGLTAITSTPGTGFTGVVTPTDNPAADAVAPTDPGSLGLGGTTSHTVAVANKGLGTVTMKGTLTLNAPSSTEAGLFTGTITFTVG